jgi:hypothetical protein
VEAQPNLAQYRDLVFSPLSLPVALCKPNAAEASFAEAFPDIVKYLQVFICHKAACNGELAAESMSHVTEQQ